jgi:hypothetical protein
VPRSDIPDSRTSAHSTRHVAIFRRPPSSSEGKQPIYIIFSRPYIEWVSRTSRNRSYADHLAWCCRTFRPSGLRISSTCIEFHLTHLKRRTADRTPLASVLTCVLMLCSVGGEERDAAAYFTGVFTGDVGDKVAPQTGIEEAWILRSTCVLPLIAGGTDTSAQVRGREVY